MWLRALGERPDNVTSKPGRKGSYDVENRLAEAAGSQAESYGYGVDNRRVWTPAFVDEALPIAYEVKTVGEPRLTDSHDSPSPLTGAVHGEPIH